MNKGLTGDLVGHAMGAYDLYHGAPDLAGAIVKEVNREQDGEVYKTQIVFTLKDGKEWSMLLMPNRY